LIGAHRGINTWISGSSTRSSSTTATFYRALDHDCVLDGHAQIAASAEGQVERCVRLLPLDTDLAEDG